MSNTAENYRTLTNRAYEAANKARPGLPMRHFDNVLQPSDQKQVYEFLNAPGWVYGWKSMPKRDMFSIWHKHFAGAVNADHEGHAQYDCAHELERVAPIVSRLWQHLNQGILKGHTLVRCYANATPFGADGTLHTDSIHPHSFTAIYYPHERWSPSWGGETVLFNKEETDIVASIYPKPNRLFVFAGVIPHVARGVARICPTMRITLMLKTIWKPSGEAQRHQ